MARPGLRRQERTDRRVALGYPRASIQKIGGFEKRGEVDLHPRCAQSLQTLDRSRKCLRIIFVAEELQLIRSRHPEAPAREALIARRPRVRVGRIKSFADVQDTCGVLGGQRKNGDAVNRSAGGYHAPRAEAP